MLCYELAAVVLVGASITEFCLYSDGTVWVQNINNA